jgi:signal transduction histidine kinase
MSPPAKPTGVLIRVPDADFSDVVSILAGAGFVLDPAAAAEAPPTELTVRRGTDGRAGKRVGELGHDEGGATAGWAAATLPAGIAHEINNPLSAVIANLELAEQLLSRLLLGSPASKDAPGPGVAAVLPQLEDEVKDALQAARHVQLLVRDARAPLLPIDSEPVDVGAVVDLAIRMASSQVRTRAHLVREMGEVPLVYSTTLRLAQVFLNLIINAAQAIPPGQPDRHEIRIATATDERGWAKITVSDSGTGITADQLPRVFSPFFSTKGADRGTGLGLPISQRIVEGLGGRIEITSEVGRGTTVTVRLPPSDRPA